jgi:hypothetical protein
LTAPEFGGEFKELPIFGRTTKLGTVKHNTTVLSGYIESTPGAFVSINLTYLNENLVKTKVWQQDHELQAVVSPRSTPILRHRNSL